MFRMSSVAILACLSAAGCASTVDVAPLPPGPNAPAVQERFRFADDVNSGVRSLLLRPTRVENLTVSGPGAGCRVLLGAVFGSGVRAGRQTVGFALVVQAIGARFGPALGFGPVIEVLVDGEVVWGAPIIRGDLYHVEPSPGGHVETLIVPMDPDRLDDIIEGGRVEVRLGSTMAFSLGPTHLRDFGELRAKISEQVDLARRGMVVEPPMRKGL